jgi:cell division protein FtsQ
MTRRRQNRRKREPIRLPALPRIRINWRAVLVPPLVIVALVVAADASRAWVDRAVTELTVEGEFQRVRPIDVEAALGALGTQRFFTLDLNTLKETVAAIDWVDQVEIKRIWPGRLHVRVTEHHAAASWGETGLLNTRGELFTDAARFEYAELPKLEGPEGSEARVATLYLDIRGRLADANLALGELSMDARGALTFVLTGGQEVRLGREAHAARLDRFFRIAAPTLIGELNRVRYIDLRYPNGFAVGWTGEPEAATPLQLASSSPDG